MISTQQAYVNNNSFQMQASLTTESAIQHQQTQQAQVQAAQRYKTELCRSFQENGTCKYGEKCQFAHGHHELRSMMRHPKYKSELCRTFHAQGYCPYGPRCHFVHEIKPDTVQSRSASNPALQDMTASRWINTKISNNAWSSCHYNSAPGSKSVSPKSDDSGLLMCALSGSSSSLFSCTDNFNVWDNMVSDKTSGRTSSSSSSSRSSTHEIISPTSSRSLSPANGMVAMPSASHLFYENDLDFSTTMLVNNIINTINNDYQFIN